MTTLSDARSLLRENAVEATATTLLLGGFLWMILALVAAGEAKEAEIAELRRIAARAEGCECQEVER